MGPVLRYKFIVVKSYPSVRRLGSHPVTYYILHNISRVYIGILRSIQTNPLLLLLSHGSGDRLPANIRLYPRCVSGSLLNICKIPGGCLDDGPGDKSYFSE